MYCLKKKRILLLIYQKDFKQKQNSYEIRKRVKEQIINHIK